MGHPCLNFLVAVEEGWLILRSDNPKPSKSWQWKLYSGACGDKPRNVTSNQRSYIPRAAPWSSTILKLWASSHVPRPRGRALPSWHCGCLQGPANYQHTWRALYIFLCYPSSRHFHPSRCYLHCRLIHYHVELKISLWRYPCALAYFLQIQ